MPYRVYATNQPDLELEVDETELVDLARQGLLVYGKGDINDRGRLKRTVAGDTSAETAQAVTASSPDSTTTATV